MELRESVRDPLLWLWRAAFAQSLSLCHICRHRFSTGRHFHHRMETSKPLLLALLNLTQHFGAANSILQPLDGYLLLFITLSAPRKHQSHLRSSCLFPRSGRQREMTRAACQEDLWTIQSPTFILHMTHEYFGNHFITSMSKSNPSLSAYNISCVEHCCDYTVHNRADQHRPT